MRRVDDPDLIRAVMCHPDIWPWVSDDFSDPVDKWEPNVAQHFWLMPNDDAAAFCVYPLRSLLWEAHMAVLPAHRKFSVQYLSAGLCWVKEHTMARSLIGFVARGNYPAMRLLEACAFSKRGIIKGAVQRSGRLCDQVIYQRAL